MKNKLLLAGFALFLITVYTACKKQDEETKPLRNKIIGKWQVNKIEINNPEFALETFTYGTGSYIDFKDNQSDDFELSLNNNKSVGVFSTRVDHTLYLDFPSKDLECVVNVVNDNQFQFTGTIVGSNPKITETYYLSR